MTTPVTRLLRAVAVLALACATYLSPWPASAEEVPILDVAWSRLLGSTANEDAAGVALLADGSSYVAATTGAVNIGGQRSHGRLDVLVARYAANGDLMWQRLFGGSGGEIASDVVAAPDGSMYVSGNSRSREIGGPGETYDFRGFVLHVSADGAPLKSWFVAPESSVIVESIAMDSAGNVYVAGWGQDPIGRRTGLSTNVVVASYAANGRLRWLRLLDQSKGIDDFTTEEAYGISVTLHGTVFLVGAQSRGNGSRDVLVASYSPGGTLRWVRTVGGVDEDQANGVVVGPNGVFVTGVTTSPVFDGHTKRPNSDLIAMKYTLSGRLVWSRLFGGTGAEAGEDIAIGSDGKLYIAGWSNSKTLLGQGTQGARDMILASYEPTGVWRWFIPIGGRLREAAAALATGPAGQLRLAGYTRGETLFGEPAHGRSDAAVVAFEPR